MSQKKTFSGTKKGSSKKYLSCGELINNRMTIREFEKKKIKDSEIKKILEVARTSPSSLNSQPWEFIIVKDSSIIKEIMNVCYYSSHINQPPVLIAIVLDPNSEIDDDIRREFQKKFIPYLKYMNIVLPALNIAYAAESLGIDSCIKSPAAKSVKKLLAIPEPLEMPIIVGLGYRKKNFIHEKTGRKELKDIVHYEKYGKQ